MLKLRVGMRRKRRNKAAYIKESKEVKASGQQV